MLPRGFETGSHSVLVEHIGTGLPVDALDLIVFGLKWMLRGNLAYRLPRFLFIALRHFDPHVFEGVWDLAEQVVDVAQAF